MQGPYEDGGHRRPGDLAMAETHEDVLERLYATILARKDANPAQSYTAALFAKGRPRVCQKVGEEAIETIIAAFSENKDAVVSESADLMYHLLVLWADLGVAPSEVWESLKAREGVSGITEKAARKN